MQLTCWQLNLQCNRAGWMGGVSWDLQEMIRQKVSTPASRRMCLSLVSKSTCYCASGILTEQQCGLPPAPPTTIFQVMHKPLQMWSPNLGLPSLQNGDSNTLLCVRNHPVSGPPLEQHRIQANKSPEARRRPSRTHPELSRLLQTPQDSADNFPGTDCPACLLQLATAPSVSFRYSRSTIPKQHQPPCPLPWPPWVSVHLCHGTGLFPQSYVPKLYTS